MLTAGAAEAKPARTVWLGLSRGPLAPAAAEALEAQIRDALGGYANLHLVDAAGHPLDPRALASDAAIVAKLVNAGIDALLELEHAKALRELDRAIEIFEARLTSLTDHELLHDAMLAKADALSSTGQKQHAKAVLVSLAALDPKRVPTAQNHSKALVALWGQAQAELGSPGVLEIVSAPKGAELRLDGRPIGAAPQLVEGVRAGRHHLVARWPSSIATRAIQLGAGLRMNVELATDGPSQRMKDELHEIIHRRRGADAAEKPIARVASIADAERVIVAGVRREDAGFSLAVALHDRAGKLIAVGRVERSGAIHDDKNLERLLLALLVDAQPGEFEIAPSGAAQPAEGVARKLYGGLGAELIEGELPEGDAEPEPKTALAEATTTTSTIALAPPPPPVAPPAPVVETSEEPRWLLWTLLGLAAAGAAVGGGLALAPRAETTEIEILLPR